MMSMTPMLACHGGFDLGPGLTMLLLSGLILWALTLLVLIPNLCLIFRQTEKPRATMAHVVFFMIYLSATMLLFSGSLFRADAGLGMVLIFAVPIMANGQFLWLFIGWRMEKREKRRVARGSDAENILSTTQTVSKKCTMSNP